MYKIAKLFISLFGVGFFPVASGTAGSLFSIIFFYLLLSYLSSFIILLIFVITFIISIKLINEYSKLTRTHDSSEIVIDEFIGISFIFIFYPYFKFSSDIITFILIFFSFRFFDIVKIFPANWIDKNITNSFGVILDDVVAGFYCVITLYLLNALI